MRDSGYQNIIVNKKSRIFTKKHHQTMEALETLLESGVPDLTTVSYTHLTLPTKA